jgi:hypothetical protein
MGLNFFRISPGLINSKWFGETDQTVRALQSIFATHQPVMMFIDEADDLLGGGSKTLKQGNIAGKTALTFQTPDSRGVFGENIDSSYWPSYGSLTSSSFSLSLSLRCNTQCTKMNTVPRRFPSPPRPLLFFFFAFATIHPSYHPFLLHFEYARAPFEGGQREQNEQTKLTNLQNILRV